MRLRVCYDPPAAVPEPRRLQCVTSGLFLNLQIVSSIPCVKAMACASMLLWFLLYVIFSVCLFFFKGGFTLFYLVLLGFIGCFWILLVFWFIGGFCWVLLSFVGFCFVFIGFYWVLLGFIGFYWVLLGTELTRVYP